jgi:hypothetical protein
MCFLILHFLLKLYGSLTDINIKMPKQQRIAALAGANQHMEVEK